MADTIDRRGFLAAGAGVLGGALFPGLLHAAPADVATEAEAFAEGAPVQSGKVRLLIAERVENGSAVPVTIEVDSAMEGADLVRSIVLLAEQNPRPIVATFHLSPLSGSAVVSTRIRLAASQRLVALARMEDGSVWKDERQVKVAIGGCVT